MRSRVRALVDAVRSWATEQDSVHVVVLVGSQVRVDTPADEFSDVDVIVFVDDPDRYLSDPSWLQQFGKPLVSVVEPTAVGAFRERRVLFTDGLDVDFSFLPTTVAETLPAEVEDVLARGFHVVYSDGVKLPTPTPTPTESRRPAQAELDELANRFWYDIVWAAKKWRRGELLLAKQVCDGLSALLVQLVHLRAREDDSWHGSRFFERWAGEEVLAGFRATSADYSREGIAQSLRATGALFVTLEAEIGERFGLRSQLDLDEVVRQLDDLLRAV